MAIDIDSEMQAAFLDAKHDAEREGHGGTAYVHGMSAAAEIIQRETLRRVWDALVSPHATNLDAQAIRAACHQVERVAREYGVSL